MLQHVAALLFLALAVAAAASNSARFCSHLAYKLEEKSRVLVIACQTGADDCQSKATDFRTQHDAFEALCQAGTVFRMTEAQPQFSNQRFPIVSTAAPLNCLNNGTRHCFGGMCFCACNSCFAGSRCQTPLCSPSQQPSTTRGPVANRTGVPLFSTTRNPNWPTDRPSTVNPCANWGCLNGGTPKFYGTCVCLCSFCFGGELCEVNNCIKPTGLPTGNPTGFTTGRTAFPTGNPTGFTTGRTAFPTGNPTGFTTGRTAFPTGQPSTWNPPFTTRVPPPTAQPSTAGPCHCRGKKIFGICWSGCVPRGCHCNSRQAMDKAVELCSNDRAHPFVQSLCGSFQL